VVTMETEEEHDQRTIRDFEGGGYVADDSEITASYDFDPYDGGGGGGYRQRSSKKEFTAKALNVTPAFKSKVTDWCKGPGRNESERSNSLTSTLRFEQQTRHLPRQAKLKRLDEELRAFVKGSPFESPGLFYPGGGDVYPLVLYVMHAPTLTECEHQKALSAKYLSDFLFKVEHLSKTTTPPAPVTVIKKEAVSTPATTAAPIKLEGGGFLNNNNKRTEPAAAAAKSSERRGFYVAYLYPFNVPRELKDISDSSIDFEAIAAKDVFLPFLSRRVRMLRPKFVVAVGSKVGRYALSGFGFHSIKSIREPNWKLQEDYHNATAKVKLSNTETTAVMICPHPFLLTAQAVAGDDHSQQQQHVVSSVSSSTTTTATQGWSDKDKKARLRATAIEHSAEFWKVLETKAKNYYAPKETKDAFEFMRSVAVKRAAESAKEKAELERIKRQRQEQQDMMTRWTQQASSVKVEEEEEAEEVEEEQGGGGHRDDGAKFNEK
jgi:hypothetical protein